MNTDLLFRQIQELKRTLAAHELSISEIHNRIYVLEEALFDLEDSKAALQRLECNDVC